MTDLNLIELPEVVLEKILSFLTFDHIAQSRILAHMVKEQEEMVDRIDTNIQDTELNVEAAHREIFKYLLSVRNFEPLAYDKDSVCRKFNALGAKMLNKGYYMAERFHEKTLKAIKSKLPRRESERKVHPLARQCDILIAIETRLSMLAVTFTKWIDANVCCFIPGKVIDEIMRVLRCVANNPNPPRPHEILQELRDISSMAMEHFDERILPILRNSARVPTYLSFKESSCSTTGGTRLGREDLLPFIPRLTSTHAQQNAPVSSAEFNKLYIRESLNSKKIKKQAGVIAKQGNDIAELRKHIEEYDAKLRDLQEKISKAQELPSTSVMVPRKGTKRKNCEEELGTDVQGYKILRNNLLGAEEEIDLQ